MTQADETTDVALARLSDAVEVRVCQEADVQHLTCSGWRVLSIHVLSAGGSQGLRFVIGKTEQRALTELRDALASTRGLLANQAAFVESAKTQVAEAQGLARRAMRERDEALARVETLTAQLDLREDQSRLRNVPVVPAVGSVLARSLELDDPPPEDDPIPF